MNLVTKWCKGCGKIMRDVQPNKRYCDKCFVSDATLGDDVFYIPKFNGKPYCGVQKGHIQAISFTKAGTRVKIREHHPHNMDFALGKTAFLDQESAEKAAKEIQNEH